MKQMYLSKNDINDNKGTGKIVDRVCFNGMNLPVYRIDNRWYRSRIGN